MHISGEMGKRRLDGSIEMLCSCGYNMLCVLDLSFTVGGGPRSAIGRAPDSKVRDSGFDTRSGNILLFLLPLFQEGQLSVTGESMCTKYWLNA